MARIFEETNIVIATAYQGTQKVMVNDLIINLSLAASSSLKFVWRKTTVSILLPTVV